MVWIILGIVVVVALFMVAMYNRLVGLRQRVGQNWSDVSVQLKQRHDLVPNLVETVKGYAAHERGTLEAVTQARNAAVTASGPGGQARAENVLAAALGQLFALSESYPNLKANQNFIQLQTDLSDLETKIAAARRGFNSSASDYNTAIQSFPMVLMAGMMGFQPTEFFELDESEQAVADTPPKVSF